MSYKLDKALESDKTIIYNLFQLYYHDLSNYEDASAIFSLNEHGLYDIKYFDYFWMEPSRYPYLLKIDNNIAGFVFVRIKENSMYEISEFFILNKYRGIGVGSFMANEIFSIHKGDWEIRALLKNTHAQAFWKKIVEKVSNGKYENKTIRDGSRVAWYFSNNM